MLAALSGLPKSIYYTSHLLRPNDNKNIYPAIPIIELFHMDSAPKSASKVKESRLTFFAD